MKIIHVIAVILTLIGGINWGFVGIAKISLVGLVFGPIGADITYILIGLSAIFLTTQFKKLV